MLTFIILCQNSILSMIPYTNLLYESLSNVNFYYPLSTQTDPSLRERTLVASTTSHIVWPTNGFIQMLLSTHKYGRRYDTSLKFKRSYKQYSLNLITYNIFLLIA